MRRESLSLPLLLPFIFRYGEEQSCFYGFLFCSGWLRDDTVKGRKRESDVRLDDELVCFVLSGRGRV